MPKLTGSMNVSQIGGSNFKFSGTRIDDLGATEYTLVTIAVDETGSVSGFSAELRDMLVASVESCKMSPRAENLLIRALTFGSQYAQGVNEIHGFKPLADIDTAQYPTIRPGNMTPLCDACYSSLGAMNSYAKDLVDNDFGVNAIAFIITDGGENASVATMAMVKAEAEQAIRGEMLESLVSVLIGINTRDCSQILADFQRDAGLTGYIDAGDVTKGKLAKLAQFVSRSVSSQSQALGTGGPSQQISATI